MTNTDSENTRLLQPFTVRWLLLLLGVPLTYAILRYHILSGVELSHFPLFIANKAIGLAAVFFIVASYLIGKTLRVYPDDAPKRLILIKFCGLTGFSAATTHAFMSLLLFSPAYYPKFFLEAGRLNLVGELSMVFGVLSLWCLSITAITSLPFMYDALGYDRWHRGQLMGYLSLALVSGHVFVMGLSGWLAPENWPGYLPNISLVAFIAALTPVVIKLVYMVTAKRTSDQNE